MQCLILHITHCVTFDRFWRFRAKIVFKDNNLIRNHDLSQKINKHLIHQMLRYAELHLMIHNVFNEMPYFLDTTMD